MPGVRILWYCIMATALCYGNRIIDEAHRLGAINAWNEAITEYERYLYFFPDSASVTVYIAMARCQTASGDFMGASQTLNRAMGLPIDDSVRADLRIEAAAYSIAGEDFQAAEFEFLRIAAFAPSPLQRIRAERYLGLVRCMTMNWPALRETTGRPGAFTVRQCARIDSLLGKSGFGRTISPIAAKWMSTVLPGLGQVYARDLKNGYNALALSAATGYLTVYALLNGYYYEALLTDVTLFWRYYSGNRVRAMEAAERHNRRIDLKLRELILSIMSGQ
jgi:tetratricopeptide (TPR) repeat protein